MKKWQWIALVLVALFVIGKFVPKKDEAAPAHAKEIIVDIAKICNKNKQEVELVLGKAEKTEGVKGYPCKTSNCERCFFKSGNYEVIFKEGKANRITINKVPNYTSDNDALERIGLDRTKYSFKNSGTIIRWENVQGIAEIDFFTEYILIQVTK